MEFLYRNSHLSWGLWMPRTLESCTQKGKEKIIFKIVALLHELEEKPRFKNRANGFQNLHFLHSARCFWVPRAAPRLRGVRPACPLPSLLQTFLTHPYSPDYSVGTRISLFIPQRPAHLRTYLYSPINGLILAGLLGALSDHDWV